MGFNMNVSNKALLDLLGIYSYAYEKHVKKGYISNGEISNTSFVFNNELKFEGVYQKTKSTWFKDIFTLTTLDISCNDIPVIRLRNSNLISKDVFDSLSKPLNNKNIKDVNKILLDIYPMFNVCGLDS